MLDEQPGDRHRFPHVPQFIVDAAGLASLFALIGGLIAPLVGPGLRLAGPVALSLGLFALWGVGLLMKAPRWLPWCIFMGTFCFIGVTLAEVLWSPRNRGTMAPADA
ncbi:MAG: hypothetical protein LC659_03505 [Myxococcales bacterium]|nr:hypothetical protein [Myxococcales bacterium]